MITPSIIPTPRFDIVLKNAAIVDGTGASTWRADVGILGDAIAEIGAIPVEQSREFLDLSGLILCPGFIDIHTHSDGVIFDHPTAESRVRQGVTTEVTGNCGLSAAPISGLRAGCTFVASMLDDEVEAAWSNVASYLERLDRTRVSVNHALLIGQGTLRENAIGLVNRAPEPDEMRAMTRELEASLEAGAFGLSTGLEYTPGSFTSTDEIVALARVTARYGGFYATHLRNEQEGLLEAIDEALAIGRRAEVPVQISHLKANGRPNWGLQEEALTRIEYARSQGIDALADAYPYSAYSTLLTALLTPDMREGGPLAITARLRDPDSRAAIEEYLEKRIQLSPGDFGLIVISRVKTARNQAVVGLNLQEVGELWSMPPTEAMIRLLVEEETDVSYVGHGMNPENVAEVLAKPWVIIGSDGSSMSPVGKTAHSRPHPRTYGTFPRTVGYYTREMRLFSLEEAIRKMTALPASRLGLRDRGRIAPGMKADLVALNAAEVIDTATFEQPHRYPLGIVHVMVNGAFVLRNARHTGAKPGQALRRN